jgi:hypothetical protein
LWNILSGGKNVKIKKTISLFLAACLLASVTSAFAADDNEERTVIGADLTNSDITASTTLSHIERERSGA